MPFAREINRLLLGVIVLFTVVVVAAYYWGVAGSASILSRPDNPRLVEARANTLRGGIYDASGVLLAETETGIRDSSGALARTYHEPSMFSALGYHNFRYGEGGIESAYNALLNGTARASSVSERLTNALLHRPQIGNDIQVTLDLRIQAAVYEALRGQRGAAVVIDVPTGRILALISLPDYDPNLLDTDWETLIADPGNPFFNRALVGAYQPGSAFQTPLMSAALLTEQTLNTPIDGATAPVQLNGLTLSCALPLPPASLSLRDAYAFACPSPFRDLTDSIGASTLMAAIETLHLDRSPALLEIFRTAAAGLATPTPTPAASLNLIAEGLGQGSITVSPLMMAMMASAIVNDGNAPQPYLLLNQRLRGTTAWEAVSAVRPSLPMMTANTARQLQDLMRNAVANGAAQNAGRPSLDIGGHAALAYSGEQALSWFVGFATLGGSSGAAVAIVLEGNADPGLAADIGGTALAAVQESR